MPSVPAGIQGIPASTIPDNPNDFVSWFKSSFLPRWAPNADIRNANSGAGINITGNLATPATVAVSAQIQALFAQPYVLVGSPVAPAVLTDYRSIAAQAGVLSLTDAGAESTITIGVAVNGIGNAQLRQSAGVSVVGNATGAEANVADITATANGQVLQMSGGLLAFGALSAGSLAAIANNTVLGNISGASASPTALTQANLTTLLDPITPTWTGEHTFTPSGSNPAIQINAKAGQFAAQVISAGSSNAAAIAYSLNGSDTGYIGVDGGQSIFGDSTNGDLCIRSGGNILLGIQQASPALTIATSSGNVNVVGGMAGFLLNGTALQAITPTWTGLHTFNAGAVIKTSSGYALTVDGLGSGAQGAFLISAGNTEVFGLIDNTATNGAYLGFSNSGTLAGYLGLGSQTISGAALADFCLSPNTGALRLGYSNGSATAILISSTGAVSIGTSTSNDVGFYGTTPVAQRATTSIQHTSNLSTLTTSASWGTADAAAFNQVISSLSEVMNTLKAYGLWSIS